MGTPKHLRPPMLTIDDALTELGHVGRSTFYRWLATGRGPRTIKLPNGKRRIRRDAFDEWLNGMHDAA